MGSSARIRPKPTKRSKDRHLHFEYTQKVLFKYCDPAGIVFFPRYAELLNDAVETFFADRIGWPFESMHPEAGVPTAAFSMRFNAPSYHGDQLSLGLTIQKLGRSSMTLAVAANCGVELRFTADQTLVCINAKGRPQSWPASVRDTVQKIMETSL